MNKEALEALDELFEYIKMDELGGIDKRQVADHYESIRAALIQQPVDLEGLRCEAVQYGANCYSCAQGYLYCDIHGGVSSVAAIKIAARTFDYLAARGLIVQDGYIAVPIEPSEAMLEAGTKQPSFSNRPEKEIMADRYKAMIKATQGEK